MILPWQEMVVAEARKWLGTPFVHRARVRGAGVDCVGLLVACYQAVGLLPHSYELPFYPPDWHLHRDEERYLAGLGEYADRVSGDYQPADILTYKYGRTVSHAGIYDGKGWLIHAFAGEGVTQSQIDIPLLTSRFQGAYRWRQPSP